MMAVLVDITTGQFVSTDDLGNLCEWLNAMEECEQDVSHLEIYPEDEAYAIFG